MRQENYQHNYRLRALKLFDHVCARCQRDFSEKNLKELTVHHINGDHEHNPPDGSNWELLCLYCHDAEHSKEQLADYLARGAGGPVSASSEKPAATFSMLGDALKHALANKDNQPES